MSKAKKNINPVEELETILWHDPENEYEEAVKIIRELEPNLTKKQAEEWVQDRIMIIRATKASLFAEMETEIEKQRADKAEEGVITDELTKIGNRGAYQQQIDFQISNAERGNKPFSLIMVDIDHFKKVNDDHSHAIGDNVLKKVAQTLKNNIRGVDMVARYGGEEFIVILPDTRKREAGLVAEKLRKAIEEQVDITHKGRRLKITISAGYAEYSAKELNTDKQLQSAADKALYHAKAEGRNRIKAYEKGMSMPHGIRLAKEMDELSTRSEWLEETLNYKKQILELVKQHKPDLTKTIENEIEQGKKQFSINRKEIEDKWAEIKRLKKKSA